MRHRDRSIEMDGVGNGFWMQRKHTVSPSHMRQTVVLHHAHRTCIGTHGGPRGAIGRLMRASGGSSSSSILRWVIHQVLLLLLVVLVLVVRRAAIGIEAKAVRRCIHGSGLDGSDRPRTEHGLVSQKRLFGRARQGAGQTSWKLVGEGPGCWMLDAGCTVQSVLMRWRISCCGMRQTGRRGEPRTGVEQLQSNQTDSSCAIFHRTTNSTARSHG